MAGCLGCERDRFVRELQRGRYAGRMIVVIEGLMSDVCAPARGIHVNSIVGTLAARTMRFCPFIFAGSPELAAAFSWRYLAAQVGGMARLPKASAQRTKRAQVDQKATQLEPESEREEPVF